MSSQKATEDLIKNPAKSKKSNSGCHESRSQKNAQQHACIVHVHTLLLATSKMTAGMHVT